MREKPQRPASALALGCHGKCHGPSRTAPAPPPGERSPHAPGVHHLRGAKGLEQLTENRRLGLHSFGSNCEHVFVGNAGTDLLDEALARGDLDAARTQAKAIPNVTLDRALRLVMLMGRYRAPSYQRAVRHFLRRFIDECEPTALQVKKTADALNVIGNPTELWIADLAWAGMVDLAGQIKRREVRLGRSFFETPWGDW